MGTVYTHIEKTAGTSIGEAFMDRYGKENVFRYDAVSDTVIRLSDRVVSSNSMIHRFGEFMTSRALTTPLVQTGYKLARNIDRASQYSPEDMPSEFDVVYGHFYTERFHDILPPTTRYTTVLRNPLSRMISHYEHWKRTRGLPRFRVRPDFSSEMTFEQFSLLPTMANYQSQALGSTVAKHELIGVVDYLPEYLEQFGFPGVNSVAKKNVGEYPMRHEFDTSFIQKFMTLHEKDYELYETAKSYWE